MSPRKIKMVCECLRVTEESLMDAIRTRKLKSVQDITCYTEAGGGCTACHPLLRQYLDYFSSAEPTCSDK